MTPHPSVLLGLQERDLSDRDLCDRLDGWVRHCGFRTEFTADADEAMRWLRRDTFAASFLDSGMERAEGEAVWRLVRPAAARRMVLMVRERRRDLWFEALRFGVATVLPMPPREVMVRAALSAVSGLRPGEERDA